MYKRQSLQKELGQVAAALREERSSHAVTKAEHAARTARSQANEAEIIHQAATAAARAELDRKVQAVAVRGRVARGSEAAADVRSKSAAQDVCGRCFRTCVYLR